MIQHLRHQAAPSGTGIDDQANGYRDWHRAVKQAKELLGLVGEESLCRENQLIVNGRAISTHEVPSLSAFSPDAGRMGD